MREQRKGVNLHVYYEGAMERSLAVAEGGGGETHREVGLVMSTAAAAAGAAQPRRNQRRAERAADKKI